MSLRSRDQLRIDLSATTLGVHVGSMALNSERAQMLLPRQKQFFEGPARPEFLWRLAKVPLDPRSLQMLVWGEELPEAQWRCEVVSGSQPEQKNCEHRRFNLRITQTGLEMAEREFHFETQAVQVHMKLTLVQTNVENEEGIFTLVPPQGFSVQRLN